MTLPKQYLKAEVDRPKCKRLKKKIKPLYEQVNYQIEQRDKVKKSTLLHKLDHTNSHVPLQLACTCSLYVKEKWFSCSRW